MMIDVLAFLVCAFNMIGLIMIMTDKNSLVEFYKKMSWKDKILDLLGIAVVAVVVVHLEIYLIVILMIEYFLLLIYLKKNKRNYPNAALKGITSIIFMLLTEVGIIGLFYLTGIGSVTSSQIQVTSYIAMATSQYFLIVYQEARLVGKGFRRMLMIALEVKALENLAWISICICGSLFEYEYSVISLLFIFAVFVCYVVFFVVTFKISERDAIEKRADIHVNTYEYYLHMEEEHRLIRKLYHEMKNQLMIIKNEPEGQTEVNAKKIKDLSERFDQLEQFYHTGISSLDILLFNSKKKAEKRGIEFEAVIQEGCLAFMKEEDVNIIFSNAIINAIEACDKIEEGPKKITIKAGENLDDILIYVKNTVSPNREKGLLHTSKKNKKVHGIGMTSIQDSVEKYDGYISIIEENNTFQLAVLFGGGCK